MRTDEYFAGLFDGDGSVGIYCVDNGRDTASGEKTYYAVRLAIAGTFKPMIEACYAHFKVGVVRQDKRQMHSLPNGVRVPSSQTRPSYHWSITRRSEIEYVLKRLQPFLIEKAEQVQIVLDFLDGKTEGQAAKEACSDAKDFWFDDFIEPPTRSRGLNAENNPNARLTYQKAEEVRERVAEGERQIDVAKDLDVSKTVISRIVNNKTYTQPPRCVAEPTQS